MTPGGRIFRVDMAAVMVATVVVGLFVLTMAVEHILPEVGAEPQKGLRPPGSAPLSDCAEGRVALTFDGGPDPEVTPQLLDLLRQKRIVTTFFVDGARAKNEVGLLRDITAGGHQIELYVPAPTADPQIDPAGRPTLAESLGVFRGNGLPAPRLVRPEGGDVDDILRWTATSNGLTPAADPGALDVGDRELVAPQTIQKRIVDGLAARKVIIAHDTSVAGLNTVAALAPTIDEVHARGYCFARLDDVDEGRGVIVVSGPEGSS